MHAKRLSRAQRERILRQGVESAFEETALRPLLSKVVRSACLLLGAEDGGIGLVAEHPRRIVMEAVHNLPSDEIGSAWLPGDGIAGRVLESGRPVVVNRYGDIDPQQRPELEDNAVLGVPITRRRRMIGFFGIGAQSPRVFNAGDVRILSQFARACATAIENARLFEETQRSLQQARLLAQTTTALSQALTLEDIVRAYLDQLAKGRTYNCSIVLYERDGQGEIAFNCQVGEYRPGQRVRTHRSRIRHERDELDPVLESGDALVFSDVRTDGRVPQGLRRIQEQEGRPALALLPLVSRNQRLGLVTLSLDRSHEWTPEELRPFLVSTAQLAAAIDARQEQARVAEEQSTLALVEERKRLARDLHDSVTQTLFAIQLFSQSLVDELEDERAVKFSKVTDLARNGLKEMRALLSELRPVEGGTVRPAADDSLSDRLQRHAASIGLTARLSVSDLRTRTGDRETDHVLFRIAQEALSNAHKHARAESLKVTLTMTATSTVLTVTDDGIGFRPDGPSAGMGLAGMRERAIGLGGSLNVASRPGHGVKITVKLPSTGT
ncbi:MAG: GAF domain-containing sensor histidine kinase [Armatimonadetes bacterium]|nr:GAF domain-containing sensor histidine kinase [Armatimonadota bacterium]